MRDTTPEAATVQAAIFRKMGPANRCMLAAKLSETVREIALAGIKQHHPEYSAEEARFALFRLLVGDELFRKAWPRAPILDP